MITNKDLSIDSENGKITLNGNKYDLGTQGEIDAAVKDVYSVMGQMGAKNLIPYPYYEQTHEDNGITWTLNSDGSVTANGTATANSTFIFRQRTEQTKFVEKNTSYILSGCPSGGSNSKYMLYLFVQTEEPTNITYGTDYGNGATINMPDQDYYGIYTFARVISGQTVSNLTFKPMLRLAADTDNTYQPYAMTNKQLTEQVAEVKDTIGDLTQTGVTGADVASQLGALNTAIGNHTYTDFTINAQSTGYASPIQSSGGVYYEALVSYAALGITKDKILSAAVIDFTTVTKQFQLYLGSSAIGALSDTNSSVYQLANTDAELKIRIAHI